MWDSISFWLPIVMASVSVFIVACLDGKCTQWRETHNDEPPPRRYRCRVPIAITIASIVYMMVYAPI